MIRLTLLLLATIAVTMIIAGEDSGQQASDGFDAPDLIGSAEADAAPRPAERLALDDEAGAIARAIAATERKDRAEPQAVVQTASLERTVEAPRDDALHYVTGSRVNLRAGPSTAEPVVGRVSHGQRAELVEETADGWMQIRLPENGRTAYIYGRFLSDSPS